MNSYAPKRIISLLHQKIFEISYYRSAVKINGRIPATILLALELEREVGVGNTPKKVPREECAT